MRNVGWNERANTPSIRRSKMSDLTGVFAVGTIVVGERIINSTSSSSRLQKR